MIIQAESSAPIPLGNKTENTPHKAERQQSPDPVKKHLCWVLMSGSSWKQLGLAWCWRCMRFHGLTGTLFRWPNRVVSRQSHGGALKTGAQSGAAAPSLGLDCAQQHCTKEEGHEGYPKDPKSEPGSNIPQQEEHVAGCCEPHPSVPLWPAAPGTQRSALYCHLARRWAAQDSSPAGETSCASSQGPVGTECHKGVRGILPRVVAEDRGAPGCQQVS